MEASKRTCYRSLQTKAPFSPELREFIANSKKSQTLYFNCEGAYRRRVVKKGEEDCLSDYIYNTLYHDGVHNRLTETDADKIKHVKIMMKKMCCSSKLYYSNGEVHFTVVWVYYFHYGLKKEMALPVFKIYKSKDKNDAIFLDTDLKLYESWNCYVESADFSESFICVPRHGEYHFDREENKLDLEFLNYSLIDTLVGHPRQSPRLKSFFPFSSHVIRPLINRVKKLNESLKEKIRSFMAFLDNFWREYNTPITCAGVFALIVAVQVFAPETISLQLSQYALMFLNSRVTERELNPFVASASYSNVSHNLPQESPSEITELRELLRQKEKNWRIIFKLMCSFLMKSRKLANLALNSLAVPPQVANTANAIFFTAEAFHNSKFLNPDNNLTVELNADASFGTLRSVVQRLEANHASLNQNPLKLNPYKNLEPAVHEDSVSFEKASTSGYIEKRENFASLDQKPGKGGDAGILEEMSLEKLLPVFDSLETDCASEIQNKAMEYYRRTPPTRVASQLYKSRWRISDLHELSLVFLRNVSVPRLTANIRYLLGKDFRLEPNGDILQNVVDISGNQMGIVFFPSEFFAICMFPLEFIE